MNTKFKNTIVASGFLGCAVVLMAIVMQGTEKMNQTSNSENDVYAKAKVEKLSTSTQQLNQQLK